MIGGLECQLVAPPVDTVFDQILTVCRRRWPGGVFLDANEDRLLPLTGPDLAWHSPTDEFFVFRDRRVAETWDDLGPCEENWNQMLHFLLRKKEAAVGSHINVTVVVDERTPEIAQLLDDLQFTFRDADSLAQLAGAT